MSHPVPQFEENEEVTQREIAAAVVEGIIPLLGCLTMLVLVISGITYVVDKSKTKNTVKGEVVSICWERSFKIEEDRGQKDSRGRIVWETINEPKTSGTDRNPYWPDETIGENQRIDWRRETYKCYIQCDNGKLHIYSTSDINKWMLYNIGDRVALEINGFESINDIALISSKVKVSPEVEVSPVTSK